MDNGLDFPNGQAERIGRGKVLKTDPEIRGQGLGNFGRIQLAVALRIGDAHLEGGVVGERQPAGFSQDPIHFRQGHGDGFRSFGQDSFEAKGE